MELAVLGTDADVLDLLTAAIEDGHQIVWIGDVRAADEPAVRSLAPARLKTSSDWETLLDHATSDAVLVGRGEADDELRAEQLKRLAADGVPLLVVHPAGLSVLAYYELDMVRRETKAILRHYNPLIGDPVQGKLARWVREGHEAMGAVVQVTCTRHLAGSSRAEVLDALARDGELLAVVAGDIHKVSAIGPRSVADMSDDARLPTSYASLQVQMTTAGTATLRWSAVPSTNGLTGIELTLVGEQGLLVWNERQRELTIGNDASQLSPSDAASEAIEELAYAVENLEVDMDESQPIARSTWDRATRAMEVVDAIELSLQKGRTIEVYQQQLTEALAFRGTMAALGCGLLLVATLVMLVTAFVGGMEWLQQPVTQSLALALLAVLLFFLGLQFVPYLASSKRPRETERLEQD